MSDNSNTGEAQATATEGRKRAAASNFLPIVRGRLPLIFVHAIRFDDVVKAMDTKSAATKFGTSVGKVFDIRKNRNFAYIDANFKPTAEDIAAAKSWAEQVGAQNAKGQTAGGDKALMEQIVKQYEERGLGTGAQRPARAAAPAAAPAAAGGSGSSETQAAAANTADALLG